MKDVPGNTVMRRIALVMAAVLLSVPFLSGCARSHTEEFHLSSLEQDFERTPCRKADGTPFRLAVMDEGPPIESSFLWLKGLCEELQAMGWLSPALDLQSAPDDFEGYYRFLLEGNTGEYLIFDDTPYYVYGTGDDAALGDFLRERAAAGEIDAIAVTGTLPGQFLKQLNLGIPFLVSFATDPVASGIISSADTASSASHGEENIWALVEPDAMKRQLLSYYQLFRFRHLAILGPVEDAEIAGVPIYEETARSVGAACSVLYISWQDRTDPFFQVNLLREARELIHNGADAFLVTYAALETDQIAYLTHLLASRGIPYLIGDGDDLVEEGGLVCISCYDYENYGHYTAQILSNIFHGQKAGDQPRIYTSSMRIVLNLTTAKQTGLLTDFAFLQSVDTVYR